MNLTNPYEGCNSKNPDACRLQTFVSREDYEFLQCLRPRHGTITCVVNILFKELCNELRRRSIESISDSHKLESFLSTIKLGSTLDGTSVVTHASEKPGGYPGVCVGDTSSPERQEIQQPEKKERTTYKAPKI